MSVFLKVLRHRVVVERLTVATQFIDLGFQFTRCDGFTISNKTNEYDENRDRNETDQSYPFQSSPEHGCSTFRRGLVVPATLAAHVSCLSHFDSNFDSLRRRRRSATRGPGTPQPNAPLLLENPLAFDPIGRHHLMRTHRLAFPNHRTNGQMANRFRHSSNTV